MKTKTKNIIKKASILSVAFAFAISAQVMAANNSTMNQTISAGSLSIDIVDAGGTTVGAPSVTFSGGSFSFSTQDTTGTLGIASEKIRISNGTSSTGWTASIAGNATTDTWTDGGTYEYDFNDSSGYTDGGDADGVGGQLTVDPSGGSIVAPDAGCTTSGVTAGASDSFDEGTTDSIDIVNGSSADPFCRWDFTGAGLSQGIPAGQQAASYTLSLVLSVV